MCTELRNQFELIFLLGQDHETDNYLVLPRIQVNLLFAFLFQVVPTYTVTSAKVFQKKTVYGVLMRTLFNFTTTRVFLRKMLGTRFGSVGTRFL